MQLLKYLPLLLVAFTLSCSDYKAPTVEDTDPEVEEIPCQVSSSWIILNDRYPSIEYVSEDYQYQDRAYTGACQPTSVLCVDGQWELISSQVQPTAEYCNNADMDCNGVIDDVSYEEIDKCEPCNPPEYDFYDYGPNSTCSYGCRACTDGIEQCIDFIGPEEELCDNLDNNCNGLIDEEVFMGECGYSREGVCDLGWSLCLAGELMCFDSVDPTPETCDGRDNDCDGLIDEDVIRDCSTVCGPGFETCEDRAWNNCNAPQPSREVCDGLDNDCDDLIDEDVTCICIAGQIQACAREDLCRGQQVCQEDGTWGDCIGLVLTDEECNGIDDDCNGIIDDGLVRSCYEAPFETLDIGECHAGTQTCTLGDWGQCEDQGLPSGEICNLLDDDCDGIADNMDIVYERVDMIFAIDVSGSMDTHLENVVAGVSEYISLIIGDDHRFGVVLFGDCLSAPGVFSMSDCPDVEYGAPELLLQLTDLSTAVTFMDSYTFSGGGGWVEPSFDAAYRMADPANPLDIAWRSDATPVLIILTDESGQTNEDLNLDGTVDWQDDAQKAEDTGELLAICELPGCNSATNDNWIDGNPVEIFVFERVTYWNVWIEVVLPYDNIRIFNIEDAESMNVNIGLIFSLICNLE